jgi:hypothetical protein
MPPNLGMWMPTGTSADVAPSTDFTGSPLAVGCCSTCSLDLVFFAAMPGPGGNPMAGHQAWAWWPARRPVGREGSWHPLSQKARIPTYIHRCHCAPPHCNCSQPTFSYLFNYRQTPQRCTLLNTSVSSTSLPSRFVPANARNSSSNSSIAFPIAASTFKTLQHLQTHSTIFKDSQKPHTIKTHSM